MVIDAGSGARATRALSVTVGTLFHGTHIQTTSGGFGIEIAAVEEIDS